jgi:hypothetical protein
MAIRDQNVLDRVNTLNTNLETGNIAEVQRNISNRLFGVLDWANNISMDSELYASINSVADASDITTSINTAKADLPSTAININYGTPHPVANSVVTLAAGAPITDTQNAINAMNTALTELNTLPNQITTLRARLQENRRILSEIHNAQSDTRWLNRDILAINTDINTVNANISTCNNLLGNLSTIRQAEQHPDFWNLGSTARQTRNNVTNTFNGAVIAWVNLYVNVWDFAARNSEVTAAKTTYDNNLRSFQQELGLAETIARNTNSLPTSTIPVPNDLGLFIANDTVVNRTILTTAGNTQTEINNIDARLDQLNTLQWVIETLRARYQDNLNRLNRILELQNLEDRMNTVYPGEMARRRNEFLVIRNISRDNLFLWNNLYVPHLPNQNVNIWWAATNVTLDFVRAPLVGPGRFDYTLCDETWNALRNVWWRFEYQLWWQIISIGGITFENNNMADQTMTIENLTINPIEWVTFPINLDLNVRVRIHDDTTWLDIDHHKPIHLTIVSPSLWLWAREHAYDTLNPPMNERIEAEYSDYHRVNLENEVIWNILREWWNENEVNEIYNNETRRNIFIERVRRELAWHFPLLTLANLQAWFRADMTREDRDVPTQYLLGEPEFQNYLRQNVSDNIRNYASTEIRRNVNPQRNLILQTFLTFQADLINNRIDNNDHLDALAAIPNDNPQWHANSAWQRFFRRRSNKNNYTKFFQWREHAVENQSLETETWTINYGVHVEVLWVNKIVATINIEGKDEPEIIDAPNHNALIRWILSRAATKDGEPLNRKLRCHLAIGALKALVMMSPQSLRRQIPVTQFQNAQWVNVDCDRIEAWVHWWNLVIRAGGVRGRTRENVTLFNENSFKNLHDVEVLERGIESLSIQINSIMNATAREYETTVNSLRNRSLRGFNTRQFLRFWPVKRLRWRMAYWRTNNDFDFTTTANAGKKSVNISYSRREFTLSWNFEWQEYEFKSRDIGTLLRRKINRKRVFDWIELEIMEQVNEAYIERLRTNSLVATENFAVADLNPDKTWRVYIFDDAWNLSYLEIEDRHLNPIPNWANAGRIPSNRLPVERIRCNEQERKEFMQNPFLSWRLRRVMRRRLALF